ncbi:hypothetical protein ABW19_dt0205228 [Dactylella cylindrospora]|nr:hypothetical protein ABW19_dt0205228 [Dactylella cylindrospora]
MARHFLATLLSLASLQLGSGSIIIGRQINEPSPTPTYTYTKDTLVKPTANARFSVGVPIDVVWYIPETETSNTAESFNVTIALNGVVAGELSSTLSYPAYGEHDTDFTPDETWPESNNYQIFIFYDYGVKTMTSGKFGIWGGGETPSPSPDPEEETSSTTKAPKTTTSEDAASATETSSTPATTSAATTSGADASSTPSSSPSASPTSSSGVSPTILGGAIGGSIVGTLAIVGVVWFMRKRMADSRATHGKPDSNGPSNPFTDNNQTMGNSGAPPSNQAWPYQNMGAHSTTSVNNDYKGFAPVGMNEMPTQMHSEPVELYAMKERVEMMGDTGWSHPPPPPPPVQQQQQQYQHQQQQGYAYGPGSYNR